MLNPLFIKLGIAVLVGGIIGLEREYQYKAAGFRTIILITVGSTLYTLFSISIAGTTDSTTRIASNIVTGIGFLGAGTILRDGGRIGGLTTAATIWLAAALGMGIGAGEIEDVLVATGVALIVLLIFPRVVSWINKIRDARTYRIVIGTGSLTNMKKLRQAFRDCHLLVSEEHLQISEESIIGSWRTIGTPGNHDDFVQTLVRNKHVIRLEY
ncbi:MAG TPA: MgtC/SapB family protein [Anaerolineales bacterium]|nr:MgtC/SapB family protein [Anaerolineales bacterium]HLO28845.1 MgtC/SapB family protein [Anaerolineales bacterium]